MTSREWCLIPEIGQRVYGYGPFVRTPPVPQTSDPEDKYLHRVALNQVPVSHSRTHHGARTPAPTTVMKDTPAPAMNTPDLMKDTLKTTVAPHLRMPGGMNTQSGVRHAHMTGTSRHPGTDVDASSHYTVNSGRTISDLNKDFNCTATDAVCVIIESFNCHGIKQCSQYVRDRVKQCDMLCLTETWLKPGEELSAIHTILGNRDKYCVFSVSGMRDADAEYSGRPYGGVAVICKVNSRLSYKLINDEFDNILVVGIYALL